MQLAAIAIIFPPSQLKIVPIMKKNLTFIFSLSLKLRRLAAELPCQFYIILWQNNLFFLRPIK